jgi:hypothetical protein
MKVQIYGGKKCNNKIPALKAPAEATYIIGTNYGIPAGDVSQPAVIGSAI